MSTTSVTVLIVAIVVVVAAVAILVWLQRRRSNLLRGRFGPEYQRAVDEYGSRTRAEKALERRAERTEKYRVRPLTHEEQQRFSDAWRRTQARFVDDPALAIREADEIIGDVMRTRGYPMAQFDRRAEDLSVDHPNVVRNYRAAHDIAVAEQQGRADTEDLRRAMVYYRELFEELLEPQPAETMDRRSRS
jgi:hypothetical protein